MHVYISWVPCTLALVFLSVCLGLGMRYTYLSQYKRQNHTGCRGEGLLHGLENFFQSDPVFWQKAPEREYFGAKQNPGPQGFASVFWLRG